MIRFRPGAMAGSATALLLAGCTVGPNYHRPDAATAPAWKENSRAAAESSQRHMEAG